VLIQSNALKAALMPYTLDGPFGRLLDAAESRLALADMQCFETEELMHEQGVVSPVLTYLFHRLGERFNGRPTLLILDEAWVFLDNPLFAARIRDWAKRANVDPARVRSGGITLNHDGGRWLSLSLPGDLPAVVREVNGQWQPQP